MEIYGNLKYKENDIENQWKELKELWGTVHSVTPGGLRIRNLTVFYLLIFSSYNNNISFEILYEA